VRPRSESAQGARNRTGSVEWLRARPPGSVIAVTGLPRTGKSRLMGEVADGFSRVLIFDPHSKRDRLNKRTGTDPEAHPWRGTLWTLEELRLYPDALNLTPIRIVVDPEVDGWDQLGAAFHRLLRMAWAAGRIDVIAEEAATYTRTAAEMVHKAATGGRHAGLRLWLLAQSIGEISIYAKRQINTIATFAQGEPADFEYLRKKAGPDFARAVQQLKPGGEPLLWALGERNHETIPEAASVHRDRITSDRVLGVPENRQAGDPGSLSQSAQRTPTKGTKNAIGPSVHAGDRPGLVGPDAGAS
jgi:hypothetical protein